MDGLYLGKVLELIYRYHPLAIAMFDMNMKYIYVSDVWFEHYNLERQNLIGKSHYEVFPEILDMPEWLDVHQRVLNGESMEKFDDPFKRDDGSIQYMHWVMKPWYDLETGKQGGALLYTEDITEQKRQLEALKQVEAAKVYLAMARSSQHILNNLITNLMYFEKKAVDSASFDDKTIKMLHSSMEESKELIAKLTSIEEVSDANIYDAINYRNV